MEISSLAAASDPTASSSGLAGATLADNFDTFLTLLTTQLKNQDPLEPMDTKEFVQELTQFSGVEQAIQTNQHLEQLLGLYQTGQATASVGYLGKSVQVQGNTNMLKDGQASWSYELSAPAASTSIIVENQLGAVVYVGAGSTASGQHDFTWDGKDNDGNPLPEGQYRVSISAVDSQNNPIDISTQIHGIVTAVRSDPTGAVLYIGDIEVPLVDVLKVTEPSTTSDGDADQTDNSNTNQS